MTLEEAYVSIYEDKRLEALKSFKDRNDNFRDIMDLAAPYKNTLLWCDHYTVYTNNYNRMSWFHKLSEAAEFLSTLEDPKDGTIVGSYTDSTHQHKKVVFAYKYPPKEGAWDMEIYDV